MDPSRETKSPEVQEGVGIKVEVQGAEGVGKDPVSLLQEFCAKRGGILPKYDFKNWCYESRVRIGELTETGEGKTKMLASEQAATRMLRQLQDKEAEGATKKSDVEETEGPGTNAVSRLQTLCAKKGIFDNPFEYGVKVRVTVGDLTVTGVDKRRKLAKRQAASNMLRQLQCGTDQHQATLFESNTVKDMKADHAPKESKDIKDNAAKCTICEKVFDRHPDRKVNKDNLRQHMKSSKAHSGREAKDSKAKFRANKGKNDSILREPEQSVRAPNQVRHEKPKVNFLPTGKIKSENNGNKPSSAGAKKPPMTLYIDGLNYIRKFFPNIDSMKSEKEKDVQKAKSKIKKFVKAAKKSAINIEVFFDKGMSTEETFKKWKSRREKELRTGKYSMVPCVSLLLGALFDLNGVKVHYSIMDNDDTIASFAFNNGGSILSKDSDFFRYISSVPGKELKLKIFSGFKFNKYGGISLIPAQENRKKSTSKRIIISPPPETRNDGIFFNKPMQWQILKHPDVYEPSQDMFYRGNVTCLLKTFPNPHLTARPLRQALYKRLGKTCVQEVIPTWNFSEKKAEWKEENVFPDDTFDSFLDSPQEALKKLFGDLNQKKPTGIKEVMWNNHLFAQKVIVAAICGWATGRSVLQSI